MNTVVKNHRLDKPADNTAYGPSWDGVTDQAPSKDAVYNKIESMEVDLVTWLWNVISWTTYTIFNTPPALYVWPVIHEFNVTKQWTYRIESDSYTWGSYVDNVIYINDVPVYSNTGDWVYDVILNKWDILKITRILNDNVTITLSALYIQFTFDYSWFIQSI